MVSVGYFETLRARLVQGRYFTDADDASRPREAIINRTMATEEFPGEEATGKRVISQYDPDHPIELQSSPALGTGPTNLELDEPNLPLGTARRKAIL